jgi:hypothetical protein
MKAQGFAGKEQHLFQEAFLVQGFVSFWYNDNHSR